eukprot:07574.XXX_73008_72645_1 [CDS] Oithona nana genome sequencing.
MAKSNQNKAWTMEATRPAFLAPQIKTKAKRLILLPADTKSAPTMRVSSSSTKSAKNTNSRRHIMHSKETFPICKLVHKG